MNRPRAAAIEKIIMALVMKSSSGANSNSCSNSKSNSTGHRQEAHKRIPPSGTEVVKEEGGKNDLIERIKMSLDGRFDIPAACCSSLGLGLGRQ